MKSKYSIGLDFGTLSARAALVNVATGEERCALVYAYPSAVIDDTLPGTDIKIPNGFAFQNPRDYFDALVSLLSGIWRKGGVAVDEIIGIGVSFTACTVIALDDNLMPMCMWKKYQQDMHSWVKLWKHHGAQKEADTITFVAAQNNEKFIRHYGSKASSEWMFPKILETLDRSPRLYEDTYCFMEAGDWIVYQLTGEVKKSSTLAGYKAFWNAHDGYPSPEFFKAVNSRFEHVVTEKIHFENAIYSPGFCAGGLTSLMAKKTGLKEGTHISVSSIDAHVGVPAVGIKEEGTLLLVMGTSLCHLLISKKEVLLDGISGVVKDGILPGFYGYEAGQAAVGDIYEWFVTNMVNYEYMNEALRRNINIYDLMDEKAAQLRPGENGIIALDWWNGNRSMLANSNLSGLLVGMNLTTKPEAIYRAIIEATAFGSRLIIDSFAASGVVIERIYACGGLSRKSPFTMQIFSDILGKEICVTASNQTASIGAAMYGAVAAGKANGGYADIFEAMENMRSEVKTIFYPNIEHRAVYNELYAQYCRLHDFFGKSNLDIMTALSKLHDKKN